MTVIDHLAPHGELSDAELISSVRSGDVSAYGDLFSRHRDAATRLARQLVSGPDADDLVSEAFAKVLNVLLAGGGPDVAFRAYLLTAVRRLHVDRIRSTARSMPTDDLSPYDEGEPFADTVIAGFEGSAAARAYASLPERWQLVLWHLEVEGQKPADVAPLLGMSPNSVSALAYRAREGLRQAYLQMHSSDLTDADCQWTHDKLGAYVRKGLSRRDAAKVEHHLQHCRKCTALFMELSEVNSSLSGVVGPVILGSAAVAYLAPAGGAAAGVGGLAGIFGQARELFLANTKVLAGVGAAAGVAGIATLAVLTANTGTNLPTATPPFPNTATPLAPPTALPPPPVKTPGPTAAPPTKAPATQVVSVLPPVVVSSTPPVTKPSNPGTPKPTHKPTPKPTPTPAPPASADLSVQLGFQARLGVLGAPNSGTLGNLQADVAGLPAGTTGTVTITIMGGTLSQIGSGCDTRGNTAVCTVWKGMSPLEFKVEGVPVSANAMVSGPQNVSDPNYRNNRDSLLLGLL